MREKDLRSLHRSAIHRVWAGDPAWLNGAVGALAGHWPEESQVGHGEKLGASNTYRLCLPAVPPVGTGRQLLLAAAEERKQYEGSICQMLES